MLSLKDFKKFEVKNDLIIKGGAVATNGSRGSDTIHDGFFMHDDGTVGGCKCPGRDAYSMDCC